MLKKFIPLLVFIGVLLLLAGAGQLKPREVREAAPQMCTKDDTCETEVPDDDEPFTNEEILAALEFRDKAIDHLAHLLEGQDKQIKALEGRCK